MVGQGIQKHNPDSIDEGYDTRAPTSRTHLEDDVLDTTLSSELHITEEDIDESGGEDTLNVSYKTCPGYEDMDEDALSVLYKTCQSEQDIEDELEDLEVMGTFQPDIAIYKQVDECVRKNTLSTLLNTRRQASTSPLYSDEIVAKGMIKESLELIALGKDKKIMFCMPCDVFSENTSLIDFLVRNLHILKTLELSTYERYQLDLLSSKMSDLVSTGTYMSEEALKLLPTDLLEKHTNYLSNLKQIVSDSIEKDVIKDVIVERDNQFYCIQCPEESVITPGKFLSNPEFQNLDGALKIGEEDNIIRLHNGQYHDMKGRVKMTFNVDGEKLEMTLFSEKAHEPESNVLHFGTIMVHMDDKSCEIFSKYLEKLEKEPRISKIVGKAKNFVEEKNGKQSKPFSVLEEVSTFKCTNCGHHPS